MITRIKENSLENTKACRHAYDPINNEWIIKPKYESTNADLISKYNKDFFFNNTNNEIKQMSKTKFTINEAAMEFTSELGNEYNFIPSHCMYERWNIYEFFFLMGYSHDYWREDGALRIPNDYLIIDSKAPDGYYITIKGMRYILKNIEKFRVTELEKKCIESNY